MVFAKGIEMNATNTVSEIYGFLLGVLIILIGAEESMLSRRLRNPHSHPSIAFKLLLRGLFHDTSLSPLNSLICVINQV